MFDKPRLRDCARAIANCHFTAGPFRDRLLLKYDGTPEEFVREAARRASATTVRVLAPGEPLVLGPARQLPA